jgi:hypothetical protein
MMYTDIEPRVLARRLIVRVFAIRVALGFARYVCISEVQKRTNGSDHTKGHLTSSRLLSATLTID